MFDVVVTADGRWAVSVSGDNTLKVWDLGSGQIIRTLQGHTKSVFGVAVTADGRWVVSASSDMTLKVWEFGRGQLVRTLEGHMGQVLDVAVTADGRWAVSVSDDKTLKVWDVATGLTVAMLEAQAPLRCCAVVSEHLLLAGDDAGALHILDWLSTPGAASAARPAAPRRPSRPARPTLSLPAPPPREAAPTKLAGAELEEIAEALLDAFPTRAALAQMLRFKLDKKLDAITAPTNQRATVFAVLVAAEEEGWVPALVDAALHAVPGNPALGAVAAKHRG